MRGFTQPLTTVAIETVSIVLVLSIVESDSCFPLPFAPDFMEDSSFSVCEGVC